MKRAINATSGKTLSDEYIKCRLFDYLVEVDQDGFLIGGTPAPEIIKGIKALRPAFDVDDVIDTSIQEGIDLDEAISILAEEYERM